MTFNKICTIYFGRYLFNPGSIKYNKLPQITILGEDNYQCTKQSILGRYLNKENLGLGPQE